MGGRNKKIGGQVALVAGRSSLKGEGGVIVRQQCRKAHLNFTVYIIDCSLSCVCIHTQPIYGPPTLKPSRQQSCRKKLTCPALTSKCNAVVAGRRHRSSSSNSSSSGSGSGGECRGGGVMGVNVVVNCARVVIVIITPKQQQQQLLLNLLHKHNHTEACHMQAVW